MGDEASGKCSFDHGEDAQWEATREQPTLSEESPLGCHQSLGGAERWHRLLQEEVRTLRLQSKEHWFGMNQKTPKAEGLQKLLFLMVCTGTVIVGQMMWQNCPDVQLATKKLWKS